MSNEVASQYAYLANVITQKARKMINDFDTHNQVSLLRIRTKKNEIIIAPGKTTISILNVSHQTLVIDTLSVV